MHSNTKYHEEGVSEEDFQEEESNFTDLISEYKMLEEASIGDDDSVDGESMWEEFNASL
eukprot:gnl/Chilomastix_caulleri/8309.p1 GENE.gnl/Chilomastix_caulleri/8309~~gnl/Chilomastix_caulleri/8309.p1  ORF type:complete len:59 (-),score=20.19 gnl/Chilomastix_caulleri/8309:61-237(-)